ncbi:MAG: hypothetical protein ACRDI2_16700 [Chloroflexota bacterium]
MTSTLDWTAVGSIATALAVLLAAWQLRRGTSQARTIFEDDLAREYRELARGIQVKPHLGEELTEDEFAQAFPRLRQYLDLTNEQIFLRMNGRIGRTTWLNWRDGIESNLRRPALSQAWSQVMKATTEGVCELSRLEASRVADDPRAWIPAWKRLWR